MTARAAALALLVAAPALADDAQDYAAACRAEVGDIPAFSCEDATIIPIIVDGREPDNYHKDMTCDLPSLLNNGPASDGQCVPWSRVLDLSDDTRQVSIMCRQKKIRDTGSMEFDEIDIIAHNPDTGATCWFQKTPAAGETIDGRELPSPTEAPEFYNDPHVVVEDGCGVCHDNDPFMYSPFMGQVWEHVPVNPFGPYYHVDAGLGFADWPTTQMQPRDSTCTGCHRIGVDQTCGQLTDWATAQVAPPGANARAMAYPLSHSMPPYHGLTLRAWEAINEQAVEIIGSCCTDPTQLMCNASPIRRDP